MLYYSINSKNKMVHFADCPRAKLIKWENKRSFKDIHEAHEEGYTMCPCCSPVLKKFRKERAYINDFCQKNGLAYFLVQDALHIHSSQTEWKLMPWNNDYRLILYHESTRCKRGASELFGYHKQNFYAHTLGEYVEYIAKHEEYRLNKSIKKNEKMQTKMAKSSKKWNKYHKREKKRNNYRRAWQVIRLIDAVCENSHCLEM